MFIVDLEDPNVGRVFNTTLANFITGLRIYDDDGNLCVDLKEEVEEVVEVESEDEVEQKETSQTNEDLIKQLNAGTTCVAPKPVRKIKKTPKISEFDCDMFLQFNNGAAKCRFAFQRITVQLVYEGEKSLHRKMNYFLFNRKYYLPIYEETKTNIWAHVSRYTYDEKSIDNFLLVDLSTFAEKKGLDDFRFLNPAKIEVEHLPFICVDSLRAKLFTKKGMVFTVTKDLFVHQPLGVSVRCKNPGQQRKLIKLVFSKNQHRRFLEHNEEGLDQIPPTSEFDKKLSTGLLTYAYFSQRRLLFPKFLICTEHFVQLVDIYQVCIKHEEEMVVLDAFRSIICFVQEWSALEPTNVLIFSHKKTGMPIAACVEERQNLMEEFLAEKNIKFEVQEFEPSYHGVETLRFEIFRDHSNWVKERIPWVLEVSGSRLLSQYLL
jgi:hypothetical protein